MFSLFLQIKLWVYLQVCDPVQLIAKMTASNSLPPLAHLRRLMKCLTSIAAIAAALEQPQLQGVVTEMVSYLYAWFDFEETSMIGVVKAGHEALDTLKTQFAALPTLLHQVCQSLQKAVLRGLRCECGAKAMRQLPGSMCMLDLSVKHCLPFLPVPPTAKFVTSDDDLSTQ